MNEFTNYDFWENYWDKVDIQPNKNIFFEELIKDFPQGGDSIEIGGFPGKLALVFHKRLKCNVTILDFFISDRIVERVERINEVEIGTITRIKADFINYKPNKKYDIVCSFGFLEHFEDSKSIISKHLDFLNKNGSLLITIPNFKGINGWIQRIFDNRNYIVHNIKCMDLNRLKSICEELNLRQIQVGYFGKPTVWVEPDAKISSFMRKLLSYLASGISYLPFKKNKILSPFIYIKALK